MRREFPPRAANANVNAAGIVDALSLKVFDPDDSFDQQFAFVDLSDHAPGEYFYVRLTQIDGEQAWSSPWWVGGRSGSERNGDRF